VGRCEAAPEAQGACLIALCFQPAQCAACACQDWRGDTGPACNKGRSNSTAPTSSPDPHQRDVIGDLVDKPAALKDSRPDPPTLINGVYLFFPAVRAEGILVR